jgi:hypothetical protein
MAERFNVPGIPMHVSESAIQTLLGTWVKPGGKVVRYVRSTGWVDSDPQDLYNMISTDLNSALAYCRSGYSDIVICLPGHTENLASADSLSNLVAGTRILGMGVGSAQATLRWTATTSTVLLSKADVIIDGMYLKMEGAAVVAPITVSGASCAITNCRIVWASGASNKATTAIEVTTGGDRFRFVGNEVEGTATHNVTNGLLVSAVVDNLIITDNVMEASATAANGLIKVAGAATHIKILRNYIHNEHTSSTAAIAIADVASTGFIDKNVVWVENNSTVTGQGIVFAGTSSTKIKCGVNYACDEPGKSGLLTPVAGT